MRIATSSLLDIVKRFVAEDQGLAAEEIQTGTQLFQDGYIDSFAVVRLIAFLEDQLGLELPPGALIPEDFASVETLEARLALL